MNTAPTSPKRRFPLWTAELLAALGLVLYIMQAAVFAHTTVSNLDEGSYLLKGYLFATDEYNPFDPGIATTKPPLSFQIPGYAQLLFGPGLRTGRYLSALFGIMAVVGLWVAAQQLTNKWLAAAAVWALACSPMIIKFYSGSTQSMVACLLAWALALSLGEKRSFWQLTGAGVCAALAMLVRVNVMPALPLLILYAFWQHGRKAWGMAAAGLGLVALTFFVYWPDFLQLWYWLPVIRIPREFLYTGGGVHVTYTPNIPLRSRILSVFQALRFHFIPTVGSLIALLYFPKIKYWKARTDLGVIVTLFLLFAGLTYMHFSAAVLRDYCPFCFSPYLAFFNVAGILLTVMLVNAWAETLAQEKKPRVVALVVLLLLFLAASAGIGFSAFEQIGGWLLNLPAPRVRDFKILPGFVTVWTLLSNKFQLDYNDALRYASAVFGWIIGLALILLGYIIWRRARTRLPDFGMALAGMILVAGIVFSPVIHGPMRDCNTDVVAANEQVGAHLRKLIPPGSLVYWDGGLSTVPLLYLVPDVKMFPAQINAGYNFLQGADTAQAVKFGYWNEVLMEEWKASADFFIVSEEYYPKWKDFFTPDKFVELFRTPVGTSCLPESRLRIFRRN